MPSNSGGMRSKFRERNDRSFHSASRSKSRKTFPRKIRRTAGPSASLLMNNRTLDRPRALEGLRPGLRPSFSAHVRWCEHGAPVQCAAAGTVHCSLNLPQASRLLGMTGGGRRFHLGSVIGIERQTAGGRTRTNRDRSVRVLRRTSKSVAYARIAETSEESTSHPGSLAMCFKRRISSPTRRS